MVEDALAAEYDEMGDRMMRDGSLLLSRLRIVKCRRRLLEVVCLLCGVILSVTLVFVEPARRPIINTVLVWQARLEGWIFTHEWNRRASRDPKLGHPLPMPNSLRALFPSEASSPCEVILLGSCAESSLKQFTRYLTQRSSTGKALQMIIVVKCEPSFLLKSLSKGKTINLQIYYDKQGDLHSAWNAFFVPRRYLVAYDGTLISLQKYPPLWSSGGGCDCENQKASRQGSYTY